MTPRDRKRIKAEAEDVLKEIFQNAPAQFHAFDPNAHPPGLDAVEAAVRLGHEVRFYKLREVDVLLMVMAGEAWLVPDVDEEGGYVDTVYEIHNRTEIERISARPPQWTDTTSGCQPRTHPVGGPCRD